jgi:hypothetical protein
MGGGGALDLKPVSLIYRINIGSNSAAKINDLIVFLFRFNNWFVWIRRQAR